MTCPDEADLRRTLVEQYRRVTDLRLNELASGNVSVRYGDGMLISCTGADETITPEQVVLVRPDGSHEGRHRPSSEWQMHWAVYRDHADANAVVHTHSDHVVAMSCIGPLPGFHYLVGLFGGSDVPCVPYYTYGSAELAETASRALTRRSACLLGSHGMLSRGRDLAEAVMLAQRLEIMCRQYLLARQLGEPYLLSPAEWQAFADKARAEHYGTRA